MKRLIKNTIILATAGASMILISAKPNTGANTDANTSVNPVEVGTAMFLRDHDQAMDLAKKTGKPVFAFFQEVPG